KFESFNFDVIIIDGNSTEQIIRAFDKFTMNYNSKTGKPTVIIAKTKMGKAVSFMEDKYQWHGNPPNEEQALLALEELK
nr:transketolase [Candidatus Kapabacteria bacterium]